MDARPLYVTESRRLTAAAIALFVLIVVVGLIAAFAALWRATDDSYAHAPSRLRNSETTFTTL